MKKLFCCLFVLAFLLAPAHPALAQNQNLFLYVDNADLTAFPKVSLRLSAWDASGKPLVDLKPAEVTLSEDGKAGFAPLSVAKDTQAPLSVVIMLDISNSMAGKPLEDARIAATRFVDHLAKEDLAGLVAFSDNVDPDPKKLTPGRELGLSTQRTPLYNALENLKSVTYTHLYNASVKAVRILAEQPAGHRAILLLSDGKNEPADVGKPDEPIKLANESGIPFFVIGLGNQVDEPYLKRLAGETGGWYRSALTSAELAALFVNMADLLKTQYLVTYTSNLPADGGMHKVEVSLRQGGSQNSFTRSIGPLPLVPTATLTATPLPPTATLRPPTVTPQPSATSVPPTVTPSQPTTTPQVIAGGGSKYGFLIAALLAVGLTLAFVWWKRRRPPPPIAEQCADCGFDMTGNPGACPHCGGTRRLPTPKL